MVFTISPLGREVKGQCAPTGRGCGNVGVSHKRHQNFRRGPNPQVGKQNWLYIFKVSCFLAGFIPDKYTVLGAVDSDSGSVVTA